MSKFLRKQPVCGTNFFIHGTITLKRMIRKTKMKKPNSHAETMMMSVPPHPMVDETK
jgi:hypothetical protein